MSFTVESKSQLARLLATENLTIEHQKIQTAKFDPTNRVLYCPIWENMSGDLYDLLMGHEVGHALYTPAEGWHDAISARGRNFKGFLNVVEDARIEKKIKRRYPGIRASFIRGYQNLIERDFFGIKNRDINSMSFVDRLNLYTKSSGTLNIDFTEEELKMVQAVESCETWEDVVRVTEVVFDYSKNEQFETYQEQMAFGGDGEELDDYDFEDSNEQGDDSAEGGDQNIGETRDVKSDSDTENQAETSGEGEEGDESTEEDNKLGNEVNRFKDSMLCESADDYQPTCETDNTYRRNESQLVSKECKPYVYVTMPEPILENIVTPAKRVHEALENYWYKDDAYRASRAAEHLRKFKMRNDRYIGLLAKEFEMKKAAKAFAKAKTSNTGDIDINKLYKYQVEDNIFKKMMRIPKGKSHGLILLLDRSGSMHDNMSGSIEQILVLTMFCRKVNIPFVVYGFGNSAEGRRADYPTQEIKNGFTQKEGDIAINHVFLREYMNSKMGNAEFNRCLRNLVELKRSYESRWGYRPANEHMSNTPLNEALVALVPITEQFRKVNNLDLVNLVIVHDGDADSTNRYRVKYDNPELTDKLGICGFSTNGENVFIREKNKVIPFNNKLDIYESQRSAFFDYYRMKTNAKIFGFFIAGKGRQLRGALSYRYYNNVGENVTSIVDRTEKNQYSWRVNYEKSRFVDGLLKEIKDEKFIESFNPGYNGFYIIPGGDDLTIHDEGLVVSGNVTASKLKTAFMKMNRKKQVNRVLVSRFIGGIAA